MKRIILIINLIIICTGCFNYKELNDYAIVTGMAIDKINNKYEVSVLIANSPKSNNESSGKNYITALYSGKGNTIYEAIKQIGLISPKELYIGHLSILIISEEVASSGINDSIEFLLEEPRSKKNFYVAISKDNKAKDVLSITTPLTDFPTESIATNLKTTKDLQGSISAIKFNTLIYNLINKGIDLSLNGVTIVGNIKKGNDTSNLESNIPKAYIKLTPIAIFKDDKLITWASNDESKGINVINDNIKEIYVNIKCNDGYIVVNTEDLKTNISINKIGNVTINTKGHAAISEINCDIDLTKQKNIKMIERKVENKIKKLNSKAINLSKKYSSDIFGIGLKYYQEEPKEYSKINNWIEFYKKIQFTNKINIKLQTVGSIKQSLERIENEENN